MREGALQAVKNCLEIEAGDRVCIITDTGTMDVAAALMERAREITPDVAFHILEDYGKRPFSSLPAQPAKDLSQSTASILAVQSLEGELVGVRQPILEIVQKRKIRHAHMVGITPEIMQQGMAANYVQLREFSEQVLRILSQVKKARVTSRAGSDFIVGFSAKIPWIKSDGRITRDVWSNLPDGEVWTIASVCSGRIVVDGVLGDYFSRKYGLLYASPLVLEIRDSRVVSVRCDNDALRDDFEKYIRTDENADRIGEFALGTNLAVRGLIGNMLQDEKYPGVHVAVGHTYPKRTGADWDSRVHCDAVLQSPTVVADGKKIMEDGRYMI